MRAGFCEKQTLSEKNGNHTRRSLLSVASINSSTVANKAHKRILKGFVVVLAICGLMAKSDGVGRLLAK